MYTIPEEREMVLDNHSISFQNQKGTPFSITPPQPLPRAGYITGKTGRLSPESPLSLPGLLPQLASVVLCPHPRTAQKEVLSYAGDMGDRVLL